jgi:hypothetical protein
VIHKNPTVWELDLPVRALKAILIILGETATAEDISHLAETTILRLPNCGWKSLRVLREALAVYGMELGTEPTFDIGLPATFEPQYGSIMQRRSYSECWKLAIQKAELLIKQHGVTS